MLVAAPPHEHKSIEQLREQYDVERELAGRLLEQVVLVGQR
jgi:hypothetical protein